EARHLFERQSDATERHGKVPRHFDAKSCLVEPRRQSRWTDGIEDFHRRHVERMLQRMPHRHCALIGIVEILRRIAAKACGPVLDHHIRMRLRGLETEAVNEWL